MVSRRRYFETSGYLSLPIFAPGIRVREGTVSGKATFPGIETSGLAVVVVVVMPGVFCDTSVTVAVEPVMELRFSFCAIVGRTTSSAANAAKINGLP